MKKSYVIYIGEMIMPNKNAAAQRVVSVAKSIQDIGYIPLVIGLNDNPSGTRVINTKTKYYDIDCFCVKYPKTKLEWVNRAITIKPIEEIIQYYGQESIKAIIALDYEAIALYKLIKFCKQKNIKLIIDNVEWYQKSKLPFPMNWAKDIDTKIRMEIIYPQTKYMICISNYLYSLYEKSYEQIAIVPGTVDKDDYKWKCLCQYRKQEVPTIGYAGYPGPNFTKERLDLLIKTVYELNKEGIECKLKIAGVNLLRMQKDLPELANTTFTENIEFLGELSHEECITMISSCDFSAIIRDDNLVTRAGFPTKLSESLACGTPVITTPSSNISDYIVDGKNGFITNDFSFESIKDTIKFAIIYTNQVDMVKMHEDTRNNNPLVYTNYTSAIKQVIEQ